MTSMSYMGLVLYATTTGGVDVLLAYLVLLLAFAAMIYLIYITVYGLIYFKQMLSLRERNYETLTIEYNDSRNIFVIIGSISVFFILLNSFTVGPEMALKSLANPVYLFGIYTCILAFIGAGLRLLTLAAKRDFRFYLAEGYCIIATKKEDEFEKSGYLFSVLDSYNKYLRRRSHIEIKEINRIYTSILLADTEEKNQMIKPICESLEQEGDKLKLAKYLSSAYKVPETDFFANESIVQRLKVVGTFFAAAIPIIISIAQLMLR